MLSPFVQRPGDSVLTQLALTLDQPGDPVQDGVVVQLWASLAFDCEERVSRSGEGDAA